MRLKELRSFLQSVDGFEKPKVQFEQYATSPEIASHVLYTMESSFGDISGKSVADLGCGSAIFTIGSRMLGAELCTGFDIDSDALDLAVRNVGELEVDCIEFVQCDIRDRSFPERWRKTFDTVVMNPPFGTKNNSGVDALFLEQALQLSRGAVYSLHKTSTRSFFQKKASELGVTMQVLAELRFNLPATYRFHKKRSVDVEVDLLRFESKPDSHEQSHGAADSAAAAAWSATASNS